MASFLLIHGAMGGAWCWERVIPGLRGGRPRGGAPSTFRARARTRRRSPEITLYRYADAVCDALDRMDGRGAVLTGHSMGGMVITQAAAQRPEKLAGLVYVAAFLPQPGQSLIDITKWPEAAGDSVQANLVVEGDPPVATMPPEAAPEALYHCCTPEQIAWALPQRAAQPVIPFTQPFTPSMAITAAFDALPRAYVTCLQDRAIKPAVADAACTRRPGATR